LSHCRTMVRYCNVIPGLENGPGIAIPSVDQMTYIFITDYLNQTISSTESDWYGGVTSLCDQLVTILETLLPSVNCSYTVHMAEFYPLNGPFISSNVHCTLSPKQCQPQIGRRSVQPFLHSIVTWQIDMMTHDDRGSSVAVDAVDACCIFLVAWCICHTGTLLLWLAKRQLLTGHTVTQWSAREGGLGIGLVYWIPLQNLKTSPVAIGLNVWITFPSVGNFF